MWPRFYSLFIAETSKHVEWVCQRMGVALMVNLNTDWLTVEKVGPTICWLAFCMTNEKVLAGHSVWTVRYIKLYLPTRLCWCIIHQKFNHSFSFVSASFSLTHWGTNILLQSHQTGHVMIVLPLEDQSSSGIELHSNSPPQLAATTSNILLIWHFHCLHCCGVSSWLAWIQQYYKDRQQFNQFTCWLCACLKLFLTRTDLNFYSWLADSVHTASWKLLSQAWL